ncbi:C6 zinc finger domain protein [Aspergillus heteromorphus CBS 117.55]|uniref:C6 zinc finger domain protein n=1 Tax=Aspergillus heteromorphus CBS 117.55 TaxID=1448321 RepID=A0A317WHT9_9EURO|nr:C6 zinc finger domain protein [Aspergillus heteromorphus CBS 117.55]PWY84832.1 C6 zinc finger domain protein [Aspergillus heteromorphus CBS 117.55]
MADPVSPAQPSGWRIPKACQECRKRKIKCNGVNPCKTCQLRHTPCIYREVIRQRKKKHHYPESSASDALASNNGASRPDYSGPSPHSPGPTDHHHHQHHQQQPPAPLTRRRNPSVSLTFNNSVSATHMASPSCKVQLYYGSTSHFALMHEIYRGLVSNNQSAEPQEPQGEVEEASAGLDMFSFRRIFFGTQAESHDPNKVPNGPDAQVLFLPYELAKDFLHRFLATLYHMVPFWPKDVFYQQLEHLYRPTADVRSDKWAQSMLLMGLAIGALATEHHHWGDVLYDRVKASTTSLDDVVNLQTVQLSMFMAHFQTEQGRPNSAFLLMGTAARTAISAGLHKEAPSDGGDAADSVEERRCTFWSLYFYEVWTCFHLGRPRSLSAKDIGIAPPEDPFLQVLIHLSKIITRSADEMYGRRHESLLQMWKIARSITDELRGYDSMMQHALGFGLDKQVQPGSLGVRQTILITLYYHTILLTFRPFLIFRGRWHRDMKMSAHREGGIGKRPTEIPTWLNEACNQALSAACRTIHHLYEASIYNDLVRELRYHGYFLGSSSFALIYDLMHGENLACTHLPWIHAALQGLSSMRPGEPISSSMSAILTVLRKIHPSYDWSPEAIAKGQPFGLDQTQAAIRHYSSDVSPHPQGPVPEPVHGGLPGGGGLAMLSDFQGNSLQDGIRMPSGSVGSGEDLLDFTQSDMGWDFDFSTMDLEAFFSINPTMDPAIF